mmetsp:Transcript_23593/g.32190  ORF Transcript_23593/g.32190 Transcript_23593/m.32190 type:complete len:739 (-) Transcript_23593:307-2523(-)|eukprot:CAMPEP_0185767226 /NCGR_PEP_ID=MMETSP1174-20130828/41833_1 /TAXON_ID=35687 /ORGANISM="Dictyocha speculum, Strain CCMP1381" /LENGTH=738 /DNA_ID=CAMNT_0028451303 /DNA_START=143 /DNA_END=2359 /DNA_ORIENTATION=+
MAAILRLSVPVLTCVAVGTAFAIQQMHENGNKNKRRSKKKQHRKGRRRSQESDLEGPQDDADLAAAMRLSLEESQAALNDDQELERVLEQSRIEADLAASCISCHESINQFPDEDLRNLAVAVSTLPSAHLDRVARIIQLHSASSEDETGLVELRQLDDATIMEVMSVVAQSQQSQQGMQTPTKSEAPEHVNADQQDLESFLTVSNTSEQPEPPLITEDDGRLMHDDKPGGRGAGLDTTSNTTPSTPPLQCSQLLLEDARACAELGSAVQSGEPDQVAHVLLEHQSSPDDVQRLVNLPVHLDHSALIVASFRGLEEVVRLLLAFDADPNYQTSIGVTALMMASESGFSKVVDMLLKAGADVDTTNKTFGATALMLASGCGEANVVETLLAAGADTEVKNTSFGATALMLASDGGHCKVVEMLLASGAKIDAQNTTGSTALQLAGINAHLPVVEMLLTAEGKSASSTRSETTETTTTSRVVTTTGDMVPEATSTCDSTSVEDAKEGSEFEVLWREALSADIQQQQQQQEEQETTTEASETEPDLTSISTSCLDASGFEEIPCSGSSLSSLESAACSSRQPSTPPPPMGRAASEASGSDTDLAWVLPDASWFQEENDERHLVEPDSVELSDSITAEMEDSKEVFAVIWAPAIEDVKPFFDAFCDGEAKSALSPGVVRSLLLPMGLSGETLRDIWELSDVDRDGRLDEGEFALALYLCRQAQEGITLPKKLPADLVPPSKR